MKKLAITLCKVFLVIALVSIPLTAQADIITNFEADTLGLAPGAPVTSTTGNVTVATNSGFTLGTGGYAPAPASFGDKFAYLTTGPEANGGGDSGFDRTGDGYNESDIATMEITFSASGPSMLLWRRMVHFQRLPVGLTIQLRALMCHTLSLSNPFLT